MRVRRTRINDKKEFMKISLPNLQRLMSLGLTPEQVTVVVDVLAEELEPLESRRKTERERQSRYRARDCHADSHVDNHVTECVTVPPLARDRDILLNTNLDNNKTLSPKPSLKTAFLEFWEAYPKRAGGNDEGAAEKAFEAAAKRHDPAVIIAGAVAYAATMRATGQAGTQFVTKARNWLNAEGWRDATSKPSKPVSPASMPVKIIEDSPAFVAWTKHDGKRPMVTEARVDGVIRRVAYVTTEFPPAQDTAA